MSGESHYLKVTGFDFSAIPAGATINGILVEVERSYALKQTEALPIDNHVKMVKGGTISGDAIYGGNIPASDTYRTFGGVTQLWGLSWTDTDIKLSTFGCVYSVTEGGGGSYRCRCDHIRITVYYTEAATGYSGQVIGVLCS
jgi:hypothetical protein